MYVHETRANKSAALNSAMERIDKGLVFFTDDDVRFEPGLLLAYAEAAQGKDRGCYFGGPIAPDYEEPPPDWIVDLLPVSAVGWTLDGQRTDWLTVDVRKNESNSSTPAVSENRQKIPNFLGANIAAFAPDLQDMGCFDERRGPGGTMGAQGQDSAMQIALARNGVDWMYVPEALVWHYVPRERCSPRWVLRRGYRIGMAAGLQMEGLDRGVLGCPNWMLRQWLKRLARMVVSRFDVNRPRRFRAAYDFRHFSGVVQGARLAAKTQEKRFRKVAL
jgi:hypothetical protein